MEVYKWETKKTVIVATTPLQEKESTHSIKSNKEDGSSCSSPKRNPREHINRLVMRESLRAWIVHCSPSKFLWFRFFQIVHKKQRRIVLQTFLLYLPTKLPCHPSNKSLTEKRRTHEMPKKEKSKCHNSLAIPQWMRRWSTDSSTFAHTTKTCQNPSSPLELVHS